MAKQTTKQTTKKNDDELSGLQSSKSQQSPFKILVVLTSHGQLGDSGKPTGWYLEEAAVPYMTFRRAGADVDIGSPQGGEPPIDPKSKDTDEPDAKAFLAEAGDKLKRTLKLSELQPAYDAIYIAGGHGAMWDLPNNPGLARLLSDTWQRGGVVSAVCHGPAGLLGAKKSDGTPLVDGKEVNGFTNEEEEQAQLTSVVPFLLEEKLKAQGAHFSRGPAMKAFVVRDGRLITGQNPASSKPLAEQVLQALKDGRVVKEEMKQATAAQQ